MSLWWSFAAGMIAEVVLFFLGQQVHLLFG